MRLPRPLAAWWKAPYARIAAATVPGRCSAVHDDGGLLSRVLESSRATVDHLNNVDLPHRFDRLERLIMATFAEAAADLATLTDEMAAKLAEYERLNTELRAAVEAGDSARAAALAAQAAEHTAVVEAISERLRGIGADSENPIPDTSPLPEAPPVETGGSDEEGPATQPPAPVDETGALDDSDLPGDEPA